MSTSEPVDSSRSDESRSSAPDPPLSPKLSGSLALSFHDSAGLEESRSNTLPSASAPDESDPDTVVVDSGSGGLGVQGALDQIHMGVYFFNHQFELIFMHDTRSLLLPDLEIEPEGISIWELYPRLEDTDFGAAVKRAAQSETGESARAYSERLGVWFEATVYPAKTGFALYVRDVSDDRSTHLQLDASLRLLERKAALLDAARDAIYVCELDGRISYWNLGAETLYGWTSDEVLGQAARDLLFTDPAASARSDEELHRLGSWAGELRQRTRSGRSITADCRWLLLRDDDHRPAFVLCVVADVTENRIEQEKRHRAQRMESLGTLAGGIAHDLNNVLTPILISAQLLGRDEEEPERVDLLSGIEASVARGSEMIRQVLAFARGQEILRTLVDFRGILTQLQIFAEETLPDSVTLTTDVPDDLWAVMADTTQVSRVLMNLVTNARDAMPDGGELAIRAWNVDGSRQSANVEQWKQIVVEVRDTGSGMDSETVQRAFEPFFTTKDAGSGTGLGLSTSVAIARAHGGDLDVRSEVGEGAAFRLHLPAALDEIDGSPVLSRPITPSILEGHGECVLVVDDEAVIRGIAKQILELNGYQVLCAGSGEEAVLLLGSTDPSVDVVFTDMMMPGRDGAALATYAREHHPTVPIIASSGIAANADIASAKGSGIGQFIAKPYTTVELLQAIRYSLTVVGHRA